MSAASPPDTRKKENRHKDSVKKRKREDVVQHNGEVEPEPAVKKSKKHKSKGVEEFAVEAGNEAARSSTTHDAKNDEEVEKRRMVDDGPVQSPEAAVKEAKKLKKKKRKSDVSEYAKDAAPGTDFVKKKKKSKKDRHNSTDDVLDSTAVPTAATSRTVSNDVLEKHSPFVQLTMSFYLGLSPCANNFPLEGLCAEHISPLLLTYYPPLAGVLLSYSNPRLSERPEDGFRTAANSGEKTTETVLAKAINEYAVTYVWLTAEFVVFRPSKGTWLEGYINLQNESLLGLVCYNYFNAGIDRSRLPADWRWVANGMNGIEKNVAQGEGYWLNGDGEKVEGRIVFRVLDFEAMHGSEAVGGSINIIGTLLSEGEERKVEDEERQGEMVKVI
ncbi:hypothetical protein M433DRAFT_158125 [Acidomyces richmondensis BFW]|nr:MAG: hypothetical protein FE78DRAFT_85815 [Acidomyces sp. 'richmondensis']KYG42240.1 hypothetical protein M433DRAFT_158125 [Acidomyces richmondensis BFW]